MSAFVRASLVIATISVLPGLMHLARSEPTELQNGQSTTVSDKPADSKALSSSGNSGAEIVQFISRVLATTEDVWHAKFREYGRVYEEPKLVLFSHATTTACGIGQSAMGPFYCPVDRKIYLDTHFLGELERIYRAPGRFAQAYVVAHEVAHHVQALLGIEEKVYGLQSKMPVRDGNHLSIRLELQADCFAGVWASSSALLAGVRIEPGDIDQGLRAAQALGDEMVQTLTLGRLVLDAFTHGSGEQRARWFKRGLESGSISQCDTFNTSLL